MNPLKFALICMMIGLTSMAAAVAGPFDAIPADTDLKSLLERWAGVEGKRLVWEAGGNATINDVGNLNAVAKLAHATNFVDALQLLSRELERQGYENQSGHKPLRLQACIYDNAIVVRTVEQPECSKPL